MSSPSWFGRTFPFLALAGLFLILSACSVFQDGKSDSAYPVIIDLEKSVGEFDGLGANVPISSYNRRTRPLQVLNDLRISTVRVQRESDNWNDIMALRAATHRLRINWLYYRENIPPQYLDEKGWLVDVPGYAEWWAEEVDELNYQEVPADRIELISGPDVANGGSAIMDSDTYNRLVHAVRSELDLMDYSDVKLVGPGLSTTDTDGLLETWYMDLDEEAYNALEYWTVQCLDDTTYEASPAQGLKTLTEHLENIDSRKRVWVTAFDNQNNVLAGQTYPHPAMYDVLGNKDGYDTYYYSASFSMPYAMELYTNTLGLLEIPDVQPFLPQLYDTPADVKFKKRSWGLLDLNGVEKPAYVLLSNFFKGTPKRSRISGANPLDDPDLMATSIHNESNIMVTVVNSSQTLKKDLRIILEGVGRSVELTRSELASAPEVNHPDLGRMDQVVLEEYPIKLRQHGERGGVSFQLKLAPQSVYYASFQKK